MLAYFFRFLKHQDEAIWITGILTVSLLVRFLTAFVSFGPYAIDDFNHNIIPAYAWMTGLPPDIPEYRTPLFVWIIKNFLLLGQTLGIGGKIPLLQFTGMLLSLCFMISNLGLYLLLKARQVAKELKIFLFLVLNIHFYLVYISTKAFGEFFSISFFLTGLGLAEYSRHTKFKKISFIAGIFLIGLSTFFRYQNGILYVTYMLYRFFFHEKKEILYFLLTGVLLTILQAAIDIVFGREPLSTLWNYLQVNKNVSEVYGRTGYFSYLAMFLGFSLFPFSLVFLKSKYKLYKLFREYQSLIFLFTVFFLIHSLIPHQEERFLAPAVPLFLIVFASLMYLHRYNSFVNAVYFPLFILFHAALLVVVVTNNNQKGMFLPVAREVERYGELAVYYKNATLVKNPYLIQFFIFQKDVSIKDAGNQDILHLFRNEQKKHIMFLTNDKKVKEEWDAKKQKIPACSDWFVETSFLDEVLYSLNPAMNSRRAPAYYFLCSK